MYTENQLLGLEEEHKNEEAKNFFLELIKDEDWKDQFKMANEPFKGSNGADHFYKTPFDILITNGVKEMADTNQAYWFIDFVLSFTINTNIPKDFQTWYLLIKDGVNYIIGEDGNHNVFVSYILPFTDFKDYKENTAVCLWLADNTLLLPEEY